MSKVIDILYRTKDYLKYDTRLTLYHNFIYPYIIHCIEVWGSFNKGNLVSLLQLEKRVLSIINSVPTESGLFFFEFGILYMMKLTSKVRMIEIQDNHVNIMSRLIARRR